MRVSDGSPLYLRSCAGSPIETNGKTRVSCPITVRPSITTCDSSRTPSSNSTSSPTIEKGPMKQPLPIRAWGLTTAVGWTLLGLIATDIKTEIRGQKLEVSKKDPFGISDLCPLASSSYRSEEHTSELQSH